VIRELRGRTWAYVGTALGITVSIAANVAHSYVPPRDAPRDWHPQAGAVVSAIFWPVALLVALEIMARVRWPSGWRWLTLRFVGLAPVGLVAGIVSYRHMAGLLRAYHEDYVTAIIGPLAVDGLMVMSAAALAATGAAVLAQSSVTTVGAPIAIEPQPESRPKPRSEPRLKHEPRPTVEPTAGSTTGTVAHASENGNGASVTTLTGEDVVKFRQQHGMSRQAFVTAAGLDSVARLANAERNDRWREADRQKAWNYMRNGARNLG
jgi:hypothetical protein